MLSAQISTLEELNAATAAAIQSRRERLLRIAQGKGIRVRVVYALTAIVLLCAVAAFLAGDRSAARILAMQSIFVPAFVFTATGAARKKARGELQDMSSRSV